MAPTWRTIGHTSSGSPVKVPQRHPNNGRVSLTLSSPKRKRTSTKRGKPDVPPLGMVRQNGRYIALPRSKPVEPPGRSESPLVHECSPDNAMLDWDDAGPLPSTGNNMDLYIASWTICKPTLRRRRRLISWPKWRECVLPAVSEHFLSAEKDLQGQCPLPRLHRPGEVSAVDACCPLEGCGCQIKLQNILCVECLGKPFRYPGDILADKDMVSRYVSSRHSLLRRPRLSDRPQTPCSFRVLPKLSGDPFHCLFVRHT
jgi:hypothetical protein